MSYLNPSLRRFLGARLKRGISGRPHAHDGYLWAAPASLSPAVRERGLSIAGMYINSRQRNTYHCSNIAIVRDQISHPVQMAERSENKIHHFEFWYKIYHFEYKIHHFKYKFSEFSNITGALMPVASSGVRPVSWILYLKWWILYFKMMGFAFKMMDFAYKIVWAATSGGRP